jgi:hypothetical protein
MPNPETPIQNEIMLALSAAGLTVWRNNTGMGWAGKARRLKDGRVVIENALPLHAGLCEGSSDVIGIKTVTITQEMVGKQIGQFVAVEVKTPLGKPPSKEQRVFLNHVRSCGGLAIVARSPDDVDLVR